MAGPWGELSPNFHQLLKVCAESRVAAMGRAQGWEAGLNMLGKVMGEIRRSMSVTVVRAQALCLLDRLAQLHTQCPRVRALRVLEDARDLVDPR